MRFRFSVEKDPYTQENIVCIFETEYGDQAPPVMALREHEGDLQVINLTKEGNDKLLKLAKQEDQKPTDTLVGEAQELSEEIVSDMFLD